MSSSSSRHSNSSIMNVALFIEPSLASKNPLDGESLRTGWDVNGATSVLSEGIVAEPDTFGAQCLLTKELATESYLESIHLYRPSSKRRVQKVQHALGFPRHSCNIDDPRNIIHLRADLRTLFDQKRWLLLPDIDLVKRILNEHQVSGKITELYGDATTFHYRFVPLGPGRLTGIIRYARPAYEVEPRPSRSVKFECYDYPFQNFPELESHVHPHWVILNAGQTLFVTTDHELDALISRVAVAYTVSDDEAKALVESIQLIYKGWVHKGKGRVHKGKGRGASRIISFIKKVVDRVRGGATRTQTTSPPDAALPQ